MKKQPKSSARKPPAAKSPANESQELPAKLARLAELEHRFAQTLEQAKLDAMKELAYGASHEINNPLANISTRAQTLLKSETHPERRRMLAAIHQQAMRAHEMIADLMLFARPPRLEPSRFDAAALCRQIVAELASQTDLERACVTLELPAEPVELMADFTQLGVALRAILLNAMEATGFDGQVHLTLTVAADAVNFTVRDNGPGIPAAALPHIFEPFFSGREAGRGLGFGLAKSWRIATAHGGTIEVQNEPGQGVAVFLTLPLLAPGPVAQ
jgi:signal transduction histidine kinase